MSSKKSQSSSSPNKLCTEPLKCKAENLTSKNKSNERDSPSSASSSSHQDNNGRENSTLGSPNSLQRSQTYNTISPSTIDSSLSFSIEVIPCMNSQLKKEFSPQNGLEATNMGTPINLENSGTKYVQIETCSNTDDNQDSLKDNIQDREVINVREETSRSYSNNTSSDNSTKVTSKIREPLTEVELCSQDPNDHTNENISITKEYLIKTMSSFEETGLVEDPAASHHHPDTSGNDDNDSNRCTTSHEYGERNTVVPSNMCEDSGENTTNKTSEIIIGLSETMSYNACTKRCQNENIKIEGHDKGIFTSIKTSKTCVARSKVPPKESLVERQSDILPVNVSNLDINRNNDTPNKTVCYESSKTHVPVIKSLNDVINSNSIRTSTQTSHASSMEHVNILRRDVRNKWDFLECSCTNLSSFQNPALQERKIENKFLDEVENIFSSGSHVCSSSDEESLDESYEESQRIRRCVGPRGLDCLPVRRIQCVREIVHCFNSSTITVLCGFQQTPRAEGSTPRTHMFHDEESLDESYEESQRIRRCVGPRGLDCLPVRRIQCVREIVHCFNSSTITVLCGFQQTPRAEGSTPRTHMFQLVYPPELTMIIPYTPFQFLSELNFHGTLDRYDQQLLQLNNIVTLQWVERSEMQGTLLVQDRTDDTESTAASQEKALNDLQDVITAHGERRSSYSSRRRLTTLLSEDIQPVVVERLIGDARRSMFYFQGPNPVTTPLGPWHNPQNGPLNLTANQTGLQDTSSVTFRDHMMASQRRQRQSRAERDTTVDDDWYRRRRERRRAGSGLYNFDQEETSLRRLGVTTYRQALENHRNQTRMGRSFQNTSQPVRRGTPSERDEVREFPYNSNSILNTIDVTASREVVEPEETISDSLSPNPPRINIASQDKVNTESEPKCTNNLSKSTKKETSKYQEPFKNSIQLIAQELYKTLKKQRHSIENPGAHPRQESVPQHECKQDSKQPERTHQRLDHGGELTVVSKPSYVIIEGAGSSSQKIETNSSSSSSEVLVIKHPISVIVKAKSGSIFRHSLESEAIQNVPNDYDLCSHSCQETSPHPRSQEVGVNMEAGATTDTPRDTVSQTDPLVQQTEGLIIISQRYSDTADSGDDSA
uniref:(California timema) hypothetical protein n=1 Tax=Timema californicum TaxID=61474 RepID=A0A7R9PD59_TIMCA|nr:unnamed protein product [Timema californicum]